MRKNTDAQKINAEPVYSIVFCGIPIRITYLHTDYDRKKEERYYYPHKHLTYELHCVRQGVSVMNIGGKRYDIEEGEFCLIAPGVYHMCENLDEAFNKLCMNLEFGWRESSDEEHCSQLLSIMTSQSVFLGNSSSFAPVLEMLSADNSRDGFLSKEAVCAELNLLLAYLVRCISNNASFKEKHDASTADLNRSRMMRIDEYFCSEFAVKPREEDLARELGVSQRQLNRILLMYYGKNFREKITESRVAVASEMLRNSNRTVEEISSCLGYSDASNFSSFFKRKTGTSPLSYRANQKVKNL